MRMGSGGRSIIHVKCACACIRKGAEGILQRVIKPDQPVAVYADAGSVRTAAVTKPWVSVFFDPSVGAGNGILDTEFANHAHKSLCPPDVAIRSNGDHMRGQIRR